MEWLNEYSERLLNNHYVKEGETIEERFRIACEFVSTDNIHLKHRLFSYIEKGWFMFSSPILSNAVRSGEKVKALPISCYVNYVDDSIKGLNDHTVETRILAVKGGGVGGHWSSVRSMNDITPGPIGFMHCTDSDMIAYKQGSTRRGSYAAYLDISHPDIEEFIKMRLPTGDINRKNLNLHHGVNITDDFLVAVERDYTWNLIDPNSKEIVSTVNARELWETILDTRFRTGEPYIHYLDEANRCMPETMKADGLKIRGSNLCAEISLPTDVDRTGICCLSSVNLAKYDEWKDTQMIEDLITMLDNVIQIFIDNAPDDLWRAKKSAIEERPLGLGAMGFHDYLTSKGIPLDNPMAISVNRQIFARIKAKALEASQDLAISRGYSKYASDLNRKNTVLLSIAPNANSSIILGVSPSIEPRLSNAYTQKTRIGSLLVKNPYLDKVLDSKELDKDKVWREIIQNEGSIQDLPYFTEEEKQLFKTAYEIDQRKVVDLAKSRMEYICQSQSVNLFFPSGTDKYYYNKVHLRAFTHLEDGFKPLKSLYYLRTESGKKTEKLALSVQREILDDGIAGDVCVNCEG